MFKTTVKIEGMMCCHCEAHVKEALKEKFGIKGADVSHENGTAIFETKNEVAEDEIKKTVEDAGYTVLSVQTDEIKGGFSLFGKK